MSTPNTHFGMALYDMLRNARAIWFIGIGGVSMSSLAMMSLRRGLRVGGYDRTRSEVTGRLEAAGIPVYDLPDPAHLDGFDAVVYTVAIAEDHPEYREAKRRGLPLISRADYLGYLMLDYRNRIGIAGSHGKSTATCMCAQIFMSACCDPTVMSGAPMRSMGGSFRLGGKDAMIFEACEYKDSFLDFNPNIAVLLNCELDHVDYFRDLEQLCASFSAFASRVGQGGTVLCNADDPLTDALPLSVGVHKLRFGVQAANADYRATAVDLTDGYASFTLMHREGALGRVRLRVPGAHNVYNALAAAAAAHICGISADRIVQGLEDFVGALRRMEYKGRLHGARVYDDYGHHPTEVGATLREARLLGRGRLICAFQPHTYSRTARLFDDYITALSEADAVVIAPIYAARETDDCGVSAARLAKALNASVCANLIEPAIGCSDISEVAGALNRMARPGDTVIVMGAGNIDSTFAGLELSAEE